MKTYGTLLAICCASVLTLVSGCGQKPKDALVMQQQQAQESIAQFRRTFAEKDATVKVGTTLSNAIVVFGKPIAFTNDDRSVEAHFAFMPYGLSYVKYGTLTNGFTLLVSNGIIVRKAYSFTTD